MTVGRTEVPVRRGPLPSPLVGEGGSTRSGETDEGVIRRFESGAGSYEDPAEAARQKKRPGKTGRPGR